MLLQKQALSLEELDAEVALELPDRETMQVVIIITDLIEDITVTVDVRNVNIAAQICAQLIATGRFECEIQQ
jgi:hypothetical protein